MAGATGSTYTVSPPNAPSTIEAWIKAARARPATRPRHSRATQFVGFRLVSVSGPSLPGVHSRRESGPTGTCSQLAARESHRLYPGELRRRRPPASTPVEQEPLLKLPFEASDPGDEAGLFADRAVPAQEIRAGTRRARLSRRRVPVRARDVAGPPVHVLVLQPGQRALVPVDQRGSELGRSIEVDQIKYSSSYHPLEPASPSPPAPALPRNRGALPPRGSSTSIDGTLRWPRGDGPHEATEPPRCARPDPGALRAARPPRCACSPEEERDQGVGRRRSGWARGTGRCSSRRFGLVELEPFNQPVRPGIAPRDADCSWHDARPRKRSTTSARPPRLWHWRVRTDTLRDNGGHRTASGLGSSHGRTDHHRGDARVRARAAPLAVAP